MAAGAFSLFCRVPVGLVVIAVAGFLVIKGKFAYLVIHGAVPIKNISLHIIRKGFTDFRLVRRVGSLFRPVMAAELGFLIFLKLVRIVKPCVALHCLIAGKFAAEICNSPITGGMVVKVLLKIIFSFCVTQFTHFRCESKL